MLVYAMKITLVGLGNVGATLAYTLVSRGLASELILIDKNPDKALGDALDLEHCQSFLDHPCVLRPGTPGDATGSDLVILTASAPMGTHIRTREELAPANARIFAELVPALAQAAPGAVFVVVSNPVDLMTTLTLEYSGLPPERVIGVGTLVDSARFRTGLSRSLGLHPDDIRAYVLGEHGDTQFPALSAAYAGGVKITDRALCERLLAESAQVGTTIVRSKGYTNFAIASATALVVESIVGDLRRSIPVSTLIQGWHGVKGICLSIPAVIGRQGITRRLLPDLTPEEIEAFRRSAAAVEALVKAARA